jgi:hypothetical protein
MSILTLSLVRPSHEIFIFNTNSHTAYHDAAHIQKLTKSDMLEFFLRYIAPKSPARAKLSIHLHARGISEVSTPIETLPSEVNDTELNSTVEKGIGMMKIDSKPAELTNGHAPHEGMTKESTSEPYLRILETSDLVWS